MTDRQEQTDRDMQTERQTEKRQGQRAREPETHREPETRREPEMHTEREGGERERESRREIYRVLEKEQLEGSRHRKGASSFHYASQCTTSENLKHTQRLSLYCLFEGRGIIFNQLTV